MSSITPAQSAAIAAVLYPLVCYLVPKITAVIPWAIKKWVPDGKFKDFLLSDA